MRRYIAAMTVIVYAALLWMVWPAGNPTHRDYASAYPTNPNPQQAGYEAEAILSGDLRLPLNHQNVFYCPVGRRPPTTATEIITIPGGSQCCNPDFLGGGFIADSKFVATLSDDGQFRCFLSIAQAQGVALWYFVREDTLVSDSMRTAIQATGGDVVYYFHANPGHDRRQVGALLFASLMATVSIGYGYRLTKSVRLSSV